MIKKIKEFYQYTSKIYLSNLAASITFYIIFMFVPLINLLNNILGILKVPGHTTDNYLIRSNVLSIVMFIISIIFVSSKAVNSLAISTNIIYAKQAKRSKFKTRLTSICLMIGFIILFVIAVALGIFITYIFKDVFKIKMYSLISLVYSFLAIIFITSLIFKYIIPVKIKFKKTFLMSFIVSIIAYFTSIVFMILIALFMNESYTNLYGSASTIMLFMMWIYILVYVYLLAIAFNYYFSKK